MSSADAALAPAPSVARLPAAVVALIGGCVLLVLRPPLLRATSAPVAVLVAVFALVGAVGAWWPAPGRDQRPGGEYRPAATVGLALLVGVGAFGAGRLIGGGHSPGTLTLHLFVLNSLAAVAEEAFFRRLCYGILGSGGAAWATAGSALLFALVHLTTYGAWVLPIDVAAGLILGWQRWATGSWRVPAVTHVLANLFVVL
ncbi:MAG TPA: CPBP family intramembrane glutamic endopeptidase [Acidimicrobiales bacterium]|nr:CPBP family intramembrane glutamic endopeptidase [Acidimicrobiales bacterium]